jgi:hypothetical protein
VTWYSDIGLRLLTQCLAVATAILAVACGREIPAGRDQPHAVAQGVKIEDIIAVDTRAPGLIVNYRTRTSIRDCKAQSSEMPQVWDLVVRGRLKDSAVPRVTLFPEDASGQSVAITFTKNASGQWSASAPCSISIPATSAPKNTQ